MAAEDLGGRPPLPDLLWTFPGQLSTDQDASIFSLKIQKTISLTVFDVNVRVAPTGSNLIIDWAINNVINSNLRVVVTAGTTYSQTIFSITLVLNDEIRPIVTQVGNSTPGQTAIMRARSL